MQSNKTPLLHFIASPHRRQQPSSSPAITVTTALLCIPYSPWAAGGGHLP